MSNLNYLKGCLVALALLGPVAGLAAQAPPATRPAAPPPSASPSPQADTAFRVKNLLNIIDGLRAELAAARSEIAQAQLERDQTQRELEELRQFMADHREFGDDFERYHAVLEATQRQAREQEQQAARERREAERAEREARRQAATLDKAQREAESARIAQYRRAGFTPVGLDVFTSRMAYSYETRDVTPSRIDYDPLIGRYTRSYPPYTQVDYSNMRISGSVLNASDQTHNIGVAITFFDEDGNQVGHESIQVNNARPNVPYPFTSTVKMALDRPFDSSSVYVLYADPIDESELPPDAASPPAGVPQMTPPQNGTTDQDYRP